MGTSEPVHRPAVAEALRRVVSRSWMDGRTKPVEQRLTIITLGVRDMGAALAFYRDGLGWTFSSVSGGDFVLFTLSGGVGLVRSMSCSHGPSRPARYCCRLRPTSRGATRGTSVIPTGIRGRLPTSLPSCLRAGCWRPISCERSGTTPGGLSNCPGERIRRWARQIRNGIKHTECQEMHLMRSACNGTSSTLRTVAAVRFLMV